MNLLFEVADSAADEIAEAVEDDEAAARSPHPPHRGQCVWGRHLQRTGLGIRVGTVDSDNGADEDQRHRRRRGGHSLQNSIVCR